MHMDKYDLAIDKFLNSIEMKEDIYTDYERVNFLISEICKYLIIIVIIRFIKIS